jgi:hypothetical protein
MVLGGITYMYVHMFTFYPLFSTDPLSRSVVHALHLWRGCITKRVSRLYAIVDITYTSYNYDTLHTIKYIYI